MPQVLVLGVGNILCEDDGVGPRVVQNLARQVQEEGLTFVDGGTGGLDLLAVLEECTHLVVVDAIDAGAAPGTIFRLGLAELGGRSTRLSFHQVGVMELLAARRLLGDPPETVVLAVQVERLGWGMNLSEAVAARLPALERAVLAEARQMLAGGDRERPDRP